MGKLLNMIEVGSKIKTKYGIWVIENIFENGTCIVIIDGNEVHMMQDEVIRKIFEREENVELSFNRHQVGVLFYYPTENDYSVVLLPKRAYAKHVYNYMVVSCDSNTKDEVLKDFPHEEFDGITEGDMWRENNHEFLKYINDQKELWYVAIVNSQNPIVIQ